MRTDTAPDDTALPNTPPVKALVADATPPRAVGLDIGKKEKLAAIEDVGIDVEIDDENDQPLYQPDGVSRLTINVCGSLSTRYRKVQAIQRGRFLTNAGKDKTAETEEAAGTRSLLEQTEAVAGCINRWSPGFTDGGRPYECTLKNAIRLLVANPHIQTKLERAMGNHARFFAQSSNGSGT